jgi:hypothetical protein
MAEEARSYEPPEVRDLGTLEHLTRALASGSKDTPTGNSKS